MFRLFKEIFTWWNGQTLSTRIHTYLYGSLVGTDEFGNIYYTSKKKTDKSKRWVIYSGYADSSKVPASWHSWLHHVTDNIPNMNINRKNWHKGHVPNLTGTSHAYKPPGSLLNDGIISSNKKYYTRWDPVINENEK
mgnify:FL=1|jgi:NADH:ubiquinone oxidoreductase subunit